MTALCRDCLKVGADAATKRCFACGSPRLVVHSELLGLSIAHLDCDAFYATVEKRDRPELRDEPVIVGGGVRGVVTTCCYIARTFGVRSAMPMFKALKACPHAVVIRPNFEKYKAESKRIMELLRALTPLVQPLSLDEAWLDLSGTERLNGGFPALVLAKVQEQIETETGLTVSVGLGPNKFLAKIASDLDKPRGFSVIGSKDAEAFLKPRPLSILPGVGPVFVRNLEKAGFRTVGDIGRADPKSVATRFGAAGARLVNLAHGRDERDVDADQARKSISAETTFEHDLGELTDLEDQLWPLCEKVALHARQSALTGRVVTLKLKAPDFKIITRRRTLGIATQTARTLFSASRSLLLDEAGAERTFRLIGVGLSDLAPSAGSETELFSNAEAKARDTENAIDSLRAKFGQDAVVSGRAFRTRAER